MNKLFEFPDCAPTLTGVRKASEKYITICADRAEEGDPIDIEIEFEAIPGGFPIKIETQIR